MIEIERAKKIVREIEERVEELRGLFFDFPDMDLSFKRRCYKKKWRGKVYTYCYIEVVEGTYRPYSYPSSVILRLREDRKEDMILYRLLYAESMTKRAIATLESGVKKMTLSLELLDEAMEDSSP